MLVVVCRTRLSEIFQYPIRLYSGGGDTKCLRVLEHATREKIPVDAGQHIANAHTARDAMLRDCGELCLNVLNVGGAPGREDPSCVATHSVTHGIFVPGVSHTQAEAIVQSMLGTKLQCPLVVEDCSE